MENQKAEKVPLINVRALYKFMVTFLIPGGIDKYDFMQHAVLHETAKKRTGVGGFATLHMP